VRTKAEHYPSVPKSKLFEEGYIAARSGHSRASTTDLTMVRIQPDGTAEPLDMGSPFDFFDPVSHTDSPDVTPAQHANRLRLKNAMEAGGFTNYADEWWHYTLDDEPYPDTYFDVVVK
jgi:zinc D-Ala-D-Ala dipeptidase